MDVAVVDPRRRTSALAGGVAATLALGVCIIPDPWLAITGHGPGSGWAVLAIAMAFTLCERLVFHIESKNEAVSISPSDVPLAIGLLILSPAALIAARIVGGALGLLIWRRPPLFKLVFNLTAFCTEIVVASLLLRLVLGSSPEPSLVLWGGLLVAMFVGLAAGGLLIAVAISFFEHDLASRVRTEAGHAYVFHLPGAVLGASAAVPLLVEAWLLILVIVPAPLVWLVMRAHGSLMHRFTDLRHVHEFSSQVSRSTHVQDIAETAVSEIASNLRASAVALVAWAEDGDLTVRAHVGDGRLADYLEAHAITESVEATEPMVDIRRRNAGNDVTSFEAFHEVVLMRLVDGGRTIGMLAAADRVGAVDRFSEDDLDRLSSMTPQLTVALRKGQLHVQIQHDATHDQLTGMPNRAYFDAWTGDALAESDRVALLLIDLDRFKDVNDVFGHHVGDRLLVETAERIATCLAGDDVACRLGGDEFAIVSPHSGHDEAMMLAASISDALERPFDFDGTAISIASSIGIALSPDHGSKQETLVRRADLAMYDAKRRHTQAVAFSPELEGSDSVRMGLLGDLRDALRDGLLEVQYQPKAALDGGAVIGAEALCRWTHPTQGPIDPSMFVVLAEQAGLIEQLTDFVLHEALTTAVGWRAAGFDMGIAVNLSAQSLLNEDLPQQVASALTRTGLAAEHLTLEVTEGCVMVDSPKTARILDRLGALGVSLSVDDFGTGYSSLVNLRRLPVHELKIDREFVTEMLLRPDDRVIVRSTIDLAHNLGLRIVAEGAETTEVLDALRSMGCDVVQGFVISRPLPADRFADWLQSRLPAREPGPRLAHRSHGGVARQQSSVGALELR